MSELCIVIRQAVWEGEWMAIMKERTWERHSNPWSVWTRLLTNPLVYLPVWNRSWRQAQKVRCRYGGECGTA